MYCPFLNLNVAIKEYKGGVQFLVYTPEKFLVPVPPCPDRLPPLNRQLTLHIKVA
jgi:hypothetical protein